MPAQLVVGLFQSSGIALDAYHRLRTEGVPARRLTYRVLQEIGPVPDVTRPELEALEVDPLVWGDVRGNFAQFIHNGETAVLVDAADHEDAEFAVGILKLYTPVAIDTFLLHEERGGG
jgi:hypothetical protein